MQTSPAGTFPTDFGPALRYMYHNPVETGFPFGSMSPLWGRQIPYAVRYLWGKVDCRAELRFLHGLSRTQESLLLEFRSLSSDVSRILWKVFTLIFWRNPRTHTVSLRSWVWHLLLGWWPEQFAALFLIQQTRWWAWWAKQSTRENLRSPSLLKLD